jgi:hypothetical protein
MSKTVNITLTEKQFKLIKLYAMIGSFIKDSIEEKNHDEIMEDMEVMQLLDKAAYESKLKGSGFDDGIYYHGADIEEEMFEIIETYDEYIESGQKSEEIEAIRKQIDGLK